MHTHSLSSYLAPGACEPVDATLTWTLVAHLGVGRTLVTTPLQGQAADVIGQAQHTSRPDTHPTLGRTLRGSQTRYEADETTVYIYRCKSISSPLKALPMEMTQYVQYTWTYFDADQTKLRTTEEV